MIQSSFRASWRDPRFREEARPGIQEINCFWMPAFGGHDGGEDHLRHHTRNGSFIFVSEFSFSSS